MRHVLGLLDGDVARVYAGLGVPAGGDPPSAAGRRTALLAIGGDEDVT